MTDEELKKLDELRETKKGMSWGTAEHGIPQLTDNELFLLGLIEKLLKDN